VLAATYSKYAKALPESNLHYVKPNKWSWFSNKHEIASTKNTLLRNEYSSCHRKLSPTLRSSECFLENEHSNCRSQIIPICRCSGKFSHFAVCLTPREITETASSIHPSIHYAHLYSHHMTFYHTVISPSTKDILSAHPKCQQLLSQLSVLVKKISYLLTRNANNGKDN